MLLYCTAWENLGDLVAWLLWLWDDPSRWEQLSYKTLLLPFPTIFILPCASIRLSFPSPSLFVLFSLLLFSYSLSGRATRGGPSQPNPEPTGTRGSIGCNSESLNSNSQCLSNEVANSAPEFFLMLLRAWDLCSQEVCPCCSLRRWQRSLPPLRNRFRYHLYHWPAKFPFRCVSTVLPSGVKWLLSLLASHHLTRRQQLLDSPTFKSVFSDHVWGKFSVWRQEGLRLFHWCLCTWESIFKGYMTITCLR